MERKQEVSKAVIQRLPRYYRNICELKAEGEQRISSKALAERMGLTASQIRQDFNCFGGFGQQGYGYNIDKLQEELGAISNHTCLIFTHICIDPLQHRFIHKRSCPVMNEYIPVFTGIFFHGTQSVQNRVIAFLLLLPRFYRSYEIHIFLQIPSGSNQSDLLPSPGSYHQSQPTLQMYEGNARVPGNRKDSDTASVS